MSFSIKFSDEYDSDGYQIASIEINNFVEKLLIPTNIYSPSWYANQWMDALKTWLSQDEAKCALITEMYPPDEAYYINSWILYKENENVYAHNRLIFLNQIADGFDYKKVNSYIDERKTVNAEGDLISEWSMNVDDVRHWYDQLQAV